MNGISLLGRFVDNAGPNLKYIKQKKHIHLAGGLYIGKSIENVSQLLNWKVGWLIIATINSLAAVMSVSLVLVKVQLNRPRCAQSDVMHVRGMYV